MSEEKVCGCASSTEWQQKVQTLSCSLAVAIAEMQRDYNLCPEGVMRTLSRAVVVMTSAAGREEQDVAMLRRVLDQELAEHMESKRRRVN